MKHQLPTAEVDEEADGEITEDGCRAEGEGESLQKPTRINDFYWGRGGSHLGAGRHDQV